MKNRITLLIDADVLVYQAAAAVETEVKWDDDLWTLHAFESDGIRCIKEKITYLKEIFKEPKTSLDMLYMFTSSVNFRKDVYPLYKANRKAKRKPIILNKLREYMMINYPSFIEPKLEGDDLLGIFSTMSYKKEEEKRIIVSIDKDMKTIPGYFFDMNKQEEGVKEISQHEADYWHMYQTLIGDATDGYSGCPGVGPKTATKILAKAPSKTYEEMWPLVVNTYEKKGLDEEDALVMARVARICRHGDYDFKTKEVKLWKKP